MEIALHHGERLFIRQVSRPPVAKPIPHFSLSPHLLRPLKQKKISQFFLPELFRFDPFLFDRLKVREDEKEALGIVQRSNHTHAIRLSSAIDPHEKTAKFSRIGKLFLFSSELRLILNFLNFHNHFWRLKSHFLLHTRRRLLNLCILEHDSTFNLAARGF